jgi:hypothetical protein
LPRLNLVLRPPPVPLVVDPPLEIPAMMRIRAKTAKRVMPTTVVVVLP